MGRRQEKGAAAAARQHHHRHEAAGHQRWPSPSCPPSGREHPRPTHPTPTVLLSGEAKLGVTRPSCFLPRADPQSLGRGGGSGSCPPSRSTESTAAMAGTERPVPARHSGERGRQRHYHDEARERAQTGTTALLQGDMGTREPGWCDTQPGRTSDPSYVATEAPLNPNKPRFISKVSLLSNATMPHGLHASFGGSLGLGLDGLGGLGAGGPPSFQPKLSFDPTVLPF